MSNIKYMIEEDTLFFFIVYYLNFKLPTLYDST